MIDDDADTVRRRLAATFDSAADVYERARPGYAPAALDWAVPRRPARVLDLAAGTGKLTAGLVERGLDVVAVDPSPAMLAQLVARLPGVDVRQGQAEAIDLPDEAVDAVVIGSALHWFDRPAADLEMARVLRPGGLVATFGNSREHEQLWVRQLDELLADYGAGHRRRDPTATRLDPSRFAPPESRAFPFEQRLDADGLADLVASRSYIIALDPARRDELLARVRELARTHHGPADFVLPYRTVVTRSYRLRS